MTVIAIIPARMAATRFPGKPLAEICGMPMIGHCCYRTRMVPGLAGVFVATCDREIADYCQSIGAPAIMTSDRHVRATDRVAEAMFIAERSLAREAAIVIMVQGDEPLITPEPIAALLPVFEDPSIDVANLMGVLHTQEEFRSQNVVKVVTNRVGDALYMSREPIPSAWKSAPGLPMRNQLGIIAFRRAALVHFSKQPETILEQCESVDMNRIIENGGRIRMVPTGRKTIGVDTPADLAVAERLMKSDPLFRTYAP